MKKIIVLIFVIGLLAACGDVQLSERADGRDMRKPMSWGQPRVIYVFADDNVWKHAYPYLKQNLARYRFTTENESYFEVRRASFNAIEEFYKFNNLIFFAHYDSDEQISTHVKNILGERARNEVEQNNMAIYPVDNLWANDQLVLFLLANNEETLLRLNILQADVIFDHFYDKLFQRIARKVYRDANYSQGAFAHLPWKADIPQYYVVYAEDRENNFISYLARRREQPDRYFAVYYENMETDKVDRTWLKETRARLAWDYYDEDEFRDEDVSSRFYTIAGYDGFRLSGRWQNQKYMVGGAFQSFAFYDEDSQLAVLIDNSVYYPQGEKLDALLELEVISRTFEIKKQEGGL